MTQATLYERLGGYGGIAGFVDSFFSRVQVDPQLGRFWQHRGDDGLIREKKITVDYLARATGGPVHYVDRDLRTTSVRCQDKKQHLDPAPVTPDSAISVSLEAASRINVEVRGQDAKGGAYSCDGLGHLTKAIRD